MKISKREQWMLALMVPVLILVISELAVLRPLRQQAHDLEREMSARGDRSKWQANLREAQMAVSTAQASLDDAKAAVERGLVKLDHAAALKEISHLCEKGGLSLVSTTQEAAPPLVPALQAAVPVLSVQNGGTAPETWKIDVRGSYAQVRGLLTALAESKTFIVPLHLGMKMDEDQMQPTSWLLTLWL